jgi:hypothetical protein
MSQKTDSQNRTAEAELDTSATNRRGVQFFDAAIAIYLLFFLALVATAAFGFHADTSKRAATVLLVVPAVLTTAAFGVLYSIFLVSSFAGIPLIKFSNSLSAMQQNWRGIAGPILLSGVLCAILALAT